MNTPYPPQQPPYPPQQPGHPAGAGGSAIALTAKFFPLSIFFLFTKPNVVVNGQLVPASWGRTVIPVPPGLHQVHVHTPYVLPPRVGPADLVANVAPGQTVELEYRVPMWAFSPGSLGTPPQKYNGMWVLWISLAIIVLAVICCCGSISVSHANS